MKLHKSYRDNVLCTTLAVLVYASSALDKNRVLAIISLPYKIYGWISTAIWFKIKMIMSPPPLPPPRRVGRHLVFALVVCPSVCLSVTKSCPFCNSKTVWDIFMKLYINVKQHETTCRAQEP